MQRNTISHKAKAERIVSGFPMQQQKNIRMIKKNNEIGEFYQIITQTHMGYDNAFLKIKLETTTKPNAKVHCKARVNDNYLECIQKMYNEGKIIHPEYKIDTERFNDENGQCHWNINFLSKPEEKMYNTFEKMKNIIDKISDSIKQMEENDDNIPEATTLITPPTTSITTTPVETPVVPPVVLPIVPPVVLPVETPDDIDNTANTDKKETKINIQQSTVSSEVNITNQPIINVPVPVPVFPLQFAPVFNELTVESLDAEKMHIYNFEMNINMMQKDLEIMKKHHEIRIKCYNELVALHNDNYILESSSDKTSIISKPEIIPINTILIIFKNFHSIFIK